MRAVAFVVANAWMVPVLSYCITGRPRWVARCVIDTPTNGRSGADLREGADG